MLFFTIFITIILAGMEIDLFTPSFPDLEKTFSLTPFSLQLMLSLNFVSFALSSLSVGFLGDRFGRRPIILLSLIIFILGSFCCVFAPNYVLLLLGRILQGLGMSGPMVLAYVVIADQYPIEKQTHLLGLLNASITISMAFAPVIGSYINYWFGWRGNFFTLLAMGIIAISFCYFILPKDNPNYNVKISFKEYIPLIKSKVFLAYVFCVTLLTIGYWIFIGISPILYMNDLNIPLKHFGFYQGSNTACFALMSLLSVKILKRFNRYHCLKIGTYCSVVFSILCVLIGVFVKDNAILIAFLMCGYGLGLVFPCNILYPICLDCVPNAKARASAFVTILRLVLTGLSLQTIGYIYNHSFLCIALFIAIPALIAFLIMHLLPQWQDKSL